MDVLYDTLNRIALDSIIREITFNIHTFVNHYFVNSFWAVRDVKVCHNWDYFNQNSISTCELRQQLLIIKRYLN